MTIDEAKTNLQINTNALDKECERLPQIFWHVSEKYSEAIDMRDTAKHALDKVWSEKYLAAKATKASDKTAEETADTDSTYDTLYKDYLFLKKLAEDWSSMKEAYEKKTVMLRELCSLLASGYYSNIAVKEQTKDTLYESRKAVIMGK